MTGKLKHSIGKTISVILSVMITIMILLVGYLTYCNLSGKIAFLGRYAFVKIVSASMEPTIPTDEYILVKKIGTADIGSLSENDVIVFRSRDPVIYGQMNTHRIIGIISDDSGTRFATKGDNNAVADSLTTASEDVLGKYCKNLPALSRISSLFAGKRVFFLLIIIPAAVLLIICIVDVIKKSKEIKMELLVQEKLKELKKGDGTLPKDNNSGTNDAGGKREE